MKFLVFYCSILLISFYNKANAQVSLDIRGQDQSFNEGTRTEVAGHPFLINSWTSGIVNLENNKNIPSKLKFDIQANQVLFQDKNGQTMVLKNKFSGFMLDNADKEISNINPLIFANGYPATGRQTENTLYQIIGDGKIKLLKNYRKEIAEHIEDTSSVVTSKYRLIKLYYIFKNNQLKQVFPNKKSFQKLLNEHTEQLSTYFESNKVDFNNDMDLQKLMVWYNSLN